MSTNISISLDTRRKKKDGTYPVVFRLGHQRRTVAIATGWSTLPQDWDSKRRCFKKSYGAVHSVTRVNAQLVKQRAALLEKIEALREQNLLAALTAKELKKHLTQKTASTSFFTYTQTLIQNLRQAQKFGNARNYETVLGVLQSYCQDKGKDDLTFPEITHRFLQSFEYAHLAKGNSINSLSVYLRVVRAVYNKAINDGVAKREHYPFHAYKIKSEPTKKRAISAEALQRILKLDLAEGTDLFHYRNYFVASYYLWGISFMDLAFLQVQNRVNGRMRYQRKKTAGRYDVRISDQLHEILSYYTEGKSPTDYIFPIIKRTVLEDQLKDIKWARKRYNKGLREIGALCGIEEKLTSYVARHSFATQALLHEIPLKAISEMLGHSALKTTEIYLKSLPTDVLDEYAERLTIG